MNNVQSDRCNFDRCTAGQVYWTCQCKDGRGETENKEETLKIKMELMGKPYALIFFFADAKNTASFMERNEQIQEVFYYAEECY